MGSSRTPTPALNGPSTLPPQSPSVGCGDRFMLPLALSLLLPVTSGEWQGCCGSARLSAWMLVGRARTASFKGPGRSLVAGATAWIPLGLGPVCPWGHGEETSRGGSTLWGRKRPLKLPETFVVISVLLLSDPVTLHGLSLYLPGPMPYLHSGSHTPLRP